MTHDFLTASENHDAGKIMTHPLSPGGSFFGVPVVVLGAEPGTRFAIIRLRHAPSAAYGMNIAPAQALARLCQTAPRPPYI